MAESRSTNYLDGYYDGVTQTLEKLANCLDPDTLDAVREEMLK